MKKYSKQLLAVSAMAFTLLFTGCAGETSSKTWAQQTACGSMELSHATQFSVDYYEDGFSLITIADTDQYLLVPEGENAPDGLPAEITVIQQPVENIYLAASSAMDLFRQLDELSRIRFTSTTPSNWAIEEVLEALDDGSLLYAGKYSAPDYELVLSQGCNLAIESTMIYHSPETKEQLESLGIPVMVERSSYEKDPLGRMEWIKLYGLLCGKYEEAEAFFSSQAERLSQICSEPADGGTVAFFYIGSNGSVTVRKPQDYVCRMIELAGGHYLPDNLQGADNALSTMNMQMEAFFAAARDADYLIYNSAIDGEMQTLSDLLEKSELMQEFKAVQTGNVWCTGHNVFQQTTGICDLVEDIHAIVTGQADDVEQLHYLYRLQ